MTMADKSVDDMLVDLLGGERISVIDTLNWLEDRLENSIRLARQKSGDDRAGWVEDAAYYAKALAIIRTLSGTEPPKITAH